jgi:AraC family transcriptional activator of mtrCDE
MQYVTSWRVKLAREALADGHMSTLAVAELAGYGSEAAFARVFKKDVGLSPAAYRNASGRPESIARD